VVVTFMREVVKMPPHELALLQASPVFSARMAAAHTLPRELRDHQAYRFQPERFSHLSIPILLLLGGDSPPMFKAAIEAIHEAIPASRVVILPGQQHIAMDTAPDLFAREVLSFLEKVTT